MGMNGAAQPVAEQEEAASTRTKRDDPPGADGAPAPPRTAGKPKDLFQERTLQWRNTESASS